jgi:hypothetical protein
MCWSSFTYFHNVSHCCSMFLKLWIFTNLNMVFPVVVLVFDLYESSEAIRGVTWPLDFNGPLIKSVNAHWLPVARISRLVKSRSPGMVLMVV